MTSEPVTPPSKPVWHWDDDFSPRLKEQAKVVVNVYCGSPPFTGTLRVDFGRLTNRADNASTTEVNESFTLLARVEIPVNIKSTSVEIDVVWDGKSTVGAPQEFSNRKTKNINTSSDVNIPMAAISNGAIVPHGLYVIDQITLLRGGAEVAKDRPAGVELSVPQIANLTFNPNWPTDVAAFGLTPFMSELEEGLRRFGRRDYNTGSSNPKERINVRFITDPSIGNTQGMKISIGGASGSLFGSTPTGPAPLFNNLYAIHDALGGDVSVYPGTFMFFNDMALASAADIAVFRSVFSPMGVAAAATSAALGTASARMSIGGKVTGACTKAEDFDNVTLTMDRNGMATVITRNETIVPRARAKDIQTALRVFVRMVGNTSNHELAHAFGVVSVVNSRNQITIGGVTVTSPLDGDRGAHNKVTNSTNIVDAGGTRDFPRRVEWTGVKQKFSTVNMRYLRDCIPYDPSDD